MNNRNEEKELLLKDLCAKLPYGVKVKIKEEGVLSYDSGIGVIVGKEHVDNEIFIIQCKNDSWCLTAISEFVPYLRPLSSMTKEEKQESRWYRHDIISDDFLLYMNRYAEWLDSKHFDWRTDGNGKTMIEIGLALEAPENMYRHFGDMDVVVNSIEHNDKL